MTFQGWRHQTHVRWIRTKKGRKARTSLPLVGCLHASLTPTLSERDFPFVSSCADTGCGLSGTAAWREPGRRRQAAAGMPPYRSRCAMPLPFYKRTPRTAVLCRPVSPHPRAPPAPLQPGKMEENTKSSRKNSRRSCLSHPPAYRAAAAHSWQHPAGGGTCSLPGSERCGGHGLLGRVSQL